MRTPVRRSGPDGPASLCNACGLRLAKKARAVAGGRVARKRTPRKASQKKKDGRKGKQVVAAQKRVQAAVEALAATTARKKQDVDEQKKPKQEQTEGQEHRKPLEHDLQRHVLPQRPQSQQTNLKVEVSSPHPTDYANQPCLTQKATLPSRMPQMLPVATSVPLCAQMPPMPATQSASPEMELVFSQHTAPENGQLSNDGMSDAMSGFFVASATDTPPCQAFITPNDLQWQTSQTIPQSAHQNSTPTRHPAVAVAAAAAHAAAVAASSASRTVGLSHSSISPGPVFAPSSVDASDGPTYLARAPQTRAHADSSASPPVPNGVFPSCFSLEQLSQHLGLPTDAVGDSPVFTDDDSAFEAIAGGLDGAFSPGQSLLSVDPFVVERKDATVHVPGLEEVLARLTEQDQRLHRIQQLQSHLSLDGTMRAVVEQAQREVETLRYTGRHTTAMLRDITSTLRME